MRSHALYYIILSVEHVLRPGRSLFYFILFYFYYNAPRETKPKDYLQCNIFRLPHVAKPMDILQFAFLIFYFEYPLNTRADLVAIFFLEYIL